MCTAARDRRSHRDHLRAPDRWSVVDRRRCRTRRRRRAACGSEPTFDLDDRDPVGKGGQHRREPVDDDLVVVHQCNRDECVASVAMRSGYPACTRRPNSRRQRIAGGIRQRPRQHAVAFRCSMGARTEPTTGDDDHFEVIVPLRTRYASTVRMIAASLGAEAGFTVDEIDDLRLALDEVFSMLAERHSGDRVRTTFRLDGPPDGCRARPRSPVWSTSSPTTWPPTSCARWSTSSSSPTRRDADQTGIRELTVVPACRVIHCRVIK